MVIKKYVVILFTVIGFYHLSKAQDIHLSQFYNCDLLLNPAKTGDFEGDYRVTANYRNQWREISKPISTYIASFDKSFSYYSQQIEAGILVARDEFSGFQSRTTKVLLSGGYFYTYKENRFRAAIQPGFVFSQTNLDLQTFPAQWDFGTGEFDMANNQEANLSPSQFYFDLNLGAQWSRQFEKFKPTVGFAVNHINRPKATYFSIFEERLRARKVFHTTINYQLKEKTTLEPKFLYMWTAKAGDMVLGTNLRHQIAHKSITSIYYGAHYRHGIKRLLDAVIPTIGLRYKKFDLGFSYDINVSSLSKNVTRKSSFEFSLIYIAASSKTRYITLPCERY